jgi:hypothetical protein
MGAIPGVVGIGNGGGIQTGGAPGGEGGVVTFCVALTTIGGLAPGAVKAGNRLAAVGTVALPGGTNTGWGMPATLGGAGAGGTTGVGNG